jgi:hypothetical protein
VPQRDSNKDEELVFGGIDVGKNASIVGVRAAAPSHRRPDALGIAN